MSKLAISSIVCTVGVVFFLGIYPEIASVYQDEAFIIALLFLVADIVVGIAFMKSRTQ